MPAKSSKQDKGLKGEAPKALIGVAAVLVAVGVAVGGFYVVNGGWKTQGQLHDQYIHEYLPIMAARHGNMNAFNAENELRKKNGEPPLEMPKDNKH